MITHKAKHRLFLLLVCGLLSAACSTGPGKKPGTLKWKLYQTPRELGHSPASWTRGGLRFDLVKVESVREHTVLETKNWHLRFNFRVRNLGTVDESVFQKAGRADVELKDGTRFEGLAFTASKVTLPPGGETYARFFGSDGRLQEMLPKRLWIDGQAVAQW